MFYMFYDTRTKVSRVVSGVFCVSNLFVRKNNQNWRFGIALYLLCKGRSHFTGIFSTIMSDKSAGDSTPTHLIPSPLITKRNRTASTCERILKSKTLYGNIRSFCREKGHGFITPEDGSDDIFVHISDIEDEYVPLPDDRVKYQLCPIPPKFEKFQAVHVHIVDLKPAIHKKWENI